MLLINNLYHRTRMLRTNATVIVILKKKNAGGKVLLSALVYRPDDDMALTTTFGGDVASLCALSTLLGVRIIVLASDME